MIVPSSPVNGTAFLLAATIFLPPFDVFVTASEKLPFASLFLESVTSELLAIVTPCGMSRTKATPVTPKLLRILMGMVTVSPFFAPVMSEAYNSTSFSMTGSSSFSMFILREKSACSADTAFASVKLIWETLISFTPSLAESQTVRVTLKMVPSSPTNGIPLGLTAEICFAPSEVLVMFLENSSFGSLSSEIVTCEFFAMLTPSGRYSLKLTPVTSKLLRILMGNTTVSPFCTPDKVLA